MENRGLLFIPDISGFTKFVSQMEIEHSRNIIQELLETIINSNDIGLNVSEVEGDAILFYKFGDMPDLQLLYRQVEKMFFEFHKRIGTYDVTKYCQCNACTAAINLTLKVITHYGEFTGYTVKEFNKLIGKDVIVAHQLLKNDIPDHEYWLVSENLIKDHPAEYKEWMRWDTSVKKTEEGEIPFHYTQLTDLKNEIPPDDPLLLEIQDKVEICSVTAEFDVHIFTAFHATGDFHFRHLWRDGVKQIDEVSHYLPRVGMKCRYIMDNEEVVIFSSGYSFSPEHIEFSETDEKQKTSYLYILDRLSPNRTRVTIKFYIRKNFFDQLRFKFGEAPKIKASLDRSLYKLGEVLKTMQPPLSAN